jgi:DNA-binding PadR family transcriptional regulator
MQGMELSAVSLAVLSLLCEEPMHPYRMQQLIRARGIDIVVNVRSRSGLHAAIERLATHGLIHVHSVESEARRPERTVYAVTATGRASLVDGLRARLAAPARDFPVFPAAVSFVHLLAPRDAQRQLELRAEELQQRLDATNILIRNSDEHAFPRSTFWSTSIAAQ